MAAQFQLYEQYKKDQSSNGHLQPQAFGTLIFDEVRVQGKVVWNSKNNQIIGVAMTPNDLPSLQDIYTSLNDDQNIQETRYILQFVWRDLTGNFDVVGPHYTSSDGFDAKFTLACLFDAMFLFETYNFHVGARVGDGASWNQTLFKKLTGHSGKFGVEAVSDDDKHSVAASFTNPCVLGALFVHHMRYVVLRYHTQMYIILCSQFLSSITYFSPSVKEHGVCAV